MLFYMYFTFLLQEGMNKNASPHNFSRMTKEQL